MTLIRQPAHVHITTGFAEFSQMELEILMALDYIHYHKSLGLSVP